LAGKTSYLLITKLGLLTIKMLVLPRLSNFVQFHWTPNNYSCNLDKQVEYAHHMFFGDGLNRPSRTEHLWMMTQMARWGHIPFPRNWVEILERVCRVSTFSTAARELGLGDIKYRRSPIQLFDGVVFDAEDPIGYLNSLDIERNFTIAEVHFDSRIPVAA
jgi:bicarbonate transport system ATP-binding protein